MMKRILALFFTIFLLHCANAQRVSTGINVHAPLLSFVHYEQNYYSPANLNRIYFVSPPEEKEKRFASSPLNPKTHFKTGIGAGYFLKVDYKWFAIRAGAQFTFQYTTFKFNEFSYDTEIDRYKQQFSMSSLNAAFPLLVSVDLKRKNNSFFVLGGADAGYFTVMSERIDELEYNRDHLSYMYGIYYNEKVWLNVNAGFGKKWKGTEWYVLYKHRIDEGKNSLTIKSSVIEANFNFYFGYSTVRKNHYLYREDE